MTITTRYKGARKAPRFSAPAEAVKVAYLSSYPPRECGVATFCEDLMQASQGSSDAMVIAIEGHASHHHYSHPVVQVVEDRDESGYHTAAQFINDSSAEVVSLQHEFGLYGGVEGLGLYRFLETLRTPLITTLHTVLPNPTPAIREMVRALAEKSGRVMVMNPIASQILIREYGLTHKKIAFLHHGAPPPSLERRESHKERLGLAGRRVMCTFGLVGASKGLEYALQALPPLVRQHPDLLYLIVGQTHPGALHQGVDEYRERLVSLTQELGIDEHVRFINRYLYKKEIISYLAASDIYITPYVNPHQICSGTLAYAVAAGRAIISTPYLHARFLLGSGRGLLVDFAHPESLAQAIAQLLQAPELQAQLEARTRAYGQRLLWPAVGARYRSLLQEVAQQRLPSPPNIVRSPVAAALIPPTAKSAA